MTALVTGAASGIGLAISGELARAGARVALTDVDGAAVQRAAASLGGRANNIIGLPLDVADAAVFEQVADEVEAALGPIAIFCSNAGVVDARSPAGRIEAIHRADWDWVMAVNVGGAFNGLLALLPRMKARNTASHIIVTGSVAGMMPQPGAPISYVVSKYALRGLCEQLRSELAPFPQIGLTLISPGIVNTAFGQNSARLAPGAAPNPINEELGSGDRTNTFMTDHMDAEAIGRRIREAIEADEHYVFTHPEYREPLATHQAAIIESFGKAAQEGRADFALG